MIPAIQRDDIVFQNGYVWCPNSRAGLQQVCIVEQALLPEESLHFLHVADMIELLFGQVIGEDSIRHIMKPAFRKCWVDLGVRVGYEQYQIYIPPLVKVKAIQQRPNRGPEIPSILPCYGGNAQTQRFIGRSARVWTDMDERSVGRRGLNEGICLLLPQVRVDAIISNVRVEEPRRGIAVGVISKVQTGKEIYS